MKRPAAWLLLGALFLGVAACDRASEPGADPAGAAFTSVGSGEAAKLIEDLNERLKPADRCTDDAPYMAEDYAGRIRNRSTAACRFSDGAPLVVYVVRNGQKTFERHFAYQRGPSYHLFGPDWVAEAYISTPDAALEVLRGQEPYETAAAH